MAVRGLLLDTPVWLFYLAGAPELPRTLRHAVDGAGGRCWLSPVSLWEVAALIQRDRLRVEGSAGEWIERALAAHPVREATLNFEVARAGATLELPGADPADRLLAATARVYELTLLTLDPNLRRAQGLDVLTA